MSADRNERKISQAYHGGDALDQAAERMIGHEVYACQSSLVDAILARSFDDEDPILSWDDVTNSQGLGPSIRRQPLPVPRLGLTGRWTCAPESVEVMEWWLVSRWLASNLEERGAVTLTDGQSHWWGRCCTGQEIILDGIMQRIVSEELWGGKLVDPRAEG